jgi:glycosyltransferase involved in cell wall biosynthesis
MICYYFPPLLDVGCKRSVSFAKYLNAHGWKPYVVSVRNPDRNFCRPGNDKAPEGIPIKYIWSLFNISWLFGKINALINKMTTLFGFELKRNILHDLFCIPDIFIGWIPGAAWCGFNAIKKYKLDVIYVSCSPFSSALVGMILKKMTGKPLVIDFRDPFAVNIPDYFDVPNFRKRINIWVEKKIIEASDVFIVNTEEVRQGYVKKYNDISNKTFTIHNGFDRALMPVEGQNKFEKFTVVYGGNMYFFALRSEAFFEALAQMREKQLLGPDTFQFLYYGMDQSTVKDIANRWKIQDIVHVYPSISHAKMLNILQKAHLQLLRIIKPMMSTKLFEGIALNLPFLATIPPGEVADIIAKYSPSSHVVHEDSPRAIGEAIMAANLAYRQGTVESNLVSQFLEHFSRERMTFKLEQAIEQILLAGNCSDK